MSMTNELLACRYKKSIQGITHLPYYQAGRQLKGTIFIDLISLNIHKKYIVFHSLSSRHTIGKTKFK